jgi:lipopolysaccharide/colanic/teichoic acid biosynthesis glycosyltransferase
MTQYAIGQSAPCHPLEGTHSPAALPAGYLALRTVLDFGVALVLLGLLGPLILLLMALVKLTSPGPALYTQIRLGRDGEPYWIFKLRTMEQDAESRSGVRWSTAGDPRVTPLGRFLRKTHLDELPQLWNVLRGEMSLIGPRPERPEIVPELERLYPNYRQRLAVKPGITGLAQVQLPADSEVSGVGRKLGCDLCYIRNTGPWLDLRILVGTALKVAGMPLPIIGAALRLPGSEAEVAIEESRLNSSPPSFAAPGLTGMTLVVPHPEPAVGMASIH